jgi:hypothetical protein
LQDPTGLPPRYTLSTHTPERVRHETSLELHPGNRPVRAGIKGDSHMMMMDKNNLQVAEVILKWLGENAK